MKKYFTIPEESVMVNGPDGQINDGYYEIQVEHFFKGGGVFIEQEDESADNKKITATIAMSDNQARQLYEILGKILNEKD